MTLTIDSSVFVAAFVDSETDSRLAYDLIEKVVTENHEVIIPVTVLIARRWGFSAGFHITEIELYHLNSKFRQPCKKIKHEWRIKTGAGAMSQDQTKFFV